VLDARTLTRMAGLSEWGTTEHFSAKSTTSERVVPLSPSIVVGLERYRGKATGLFGSIITPGRTCPRRVDSLGHANLDVAQRHYAENRNKASSKDRQGPDEINGFLIRDRAAGRRRRSNRGLRGFGSIPTLASRFAAWAAMTCENWKSDFQ
jgi:hypothetical protein